MTEAELDAHLFSAGVGSDARGKLVLVVGDYDGLFATRIREFGGEPVTEDHYREAYESGTADAAIIRLPSGDGSRMRLVETALRPEARYVMVVEPAAHEPKLVLVNVEQIGDACVRITGMRVRLAGE